MPKNETFEILKNNYIIGKRAWYLALNNNNLYLKSIVYDTIWPGGEVLRSQCPSCWAYDVPDVEHDCGIHAVKDWKECAYWSRWVLFNKIGVTIFGEVSIWGKIISNEFEYRVEKAFPYVLYVPEYPYSLKNGFQLTGTEIQEGLKKTYGVPVYIGYPLELIEINREFVQKYRI